MVVETIANRNLTGFQDIFIWSNDVTGGIFLPLMFFTIFITITLAGYGFQKRSFGYANFWLHSTIGGLSTFVLEVILINIPGLISIKTLIITMLITLISFIAFIFFNAEE